MLLLVEEMGTFGSLLVFPALQDLTIVQKIKTQPCAEIAMYKLNQLKCNCCLSIFDSRIGLRAAALLIAVGFGVGTVVPAIAQKVSADEDDLVEELDHCPPASMHRTHSDSSQNAEFVYFSDVEDCGDGSHLNMINLVKNIHTSESLIFRWDKGNLSRSKFRPLDPGERAENGWPISGYETIPDSDAPIQYTQSYRPYTNASVFKEEKKDENDAREFRSYLRNSLTDMSGKKIEIIFNFSTSFDGKEIFSRMSLSPPDLTVALSGIPSYLSRLSPGDRQSVEQTMSEQLAQQSVKTGVYELSRLVDREEIDMLATKLREDGFVMTFFVPHSDVISFAIPSLVPDSEETKVTVPRLSTFNAVVIDNKGFVVASGNVGLLLP